MRLVFFILAQISFVLGHGELDKEIFRISEKISVEPGNPEHWLTRAGLHQSHRDLKAALSDLKQATQIAPPHPPAFLALAKFQRKQGATAEAAVALKRYFSTLSGTAPDPVALRENALLSPPEKASGAWQRFFDSNGNATMNDYVEAARSALTVGQTESTRKFLLAGLARHPKSIPLHQLNARLSLKNKEDDSAENSFKALEFLYPTLLVKLRYEESLIWKEYTHPDRAQSALQSALAAYQQLPAHLQKNPDFHQLVAKIKASLHQ